MGETSIFGAREQHRHYKQMIGIMHPRKHHTAKSNSKLLAILDMLKNDGFITQEVGQVAKCIPRLPMCSVFSCSALDDDCNIQ